MYDYTTEASEGKITLASGSSVKFNINELIKNFVLVLKWLNLPQNNRRKPTIGIDKNLVTKYFIELKQLWNL